MTTAAPWAGMKAKSNLSSETPPAGTFPAVLIAIVDLGTHENTYQGKTTKARQVWIAWEIMENMTGTKGGHHVIGKRFTLSFGSKAALRQMVEKWRGKALNDGEDFDLSKLLGKPCLVSIVHTAKGDNTYAGVEGVVSLPKGMPTPEAQNKPFAWYIGSEENYPEPTWMPYCFGSPVREVILDSFELRGKANTNEKPNNPGSSAGSNGAASGPQNEQEDSIPF